MQAEHRHAEEVDDHEETLRRIKSVRALQSGTQRATCHVHRTGCNKRKPQANVYECAEGLTDVLLRAVQDRERELGDLHAGVQSKRTAFSTVRSGAACSAVTKYIPALWYSHCWQQTA